MTKVKFLIEKTGDGVFAYFPEIVHSFNGYRPDNMTCYAHIGQHSACHPEYANECKEAAYNEYSDLLEELVGQGYDDLLVLNTMQPVIKCDYTYWRKPTAYEIKFGEGAIHYRDFTLFEIGYNKAGKLKNWIVAKDDGLRYYR